MKKIGYICYHSGRHIMEGSISLKHGRIYKTKKKCKKSCEFIERLFGIKYKFAPLYIDDDVNIKLIDIDNE